MNRLHPDNSSGCFQHIREAERQGRDRISAHGRASFSRHAGKVPTER